MDERTREWMTGRFWDEGEVLAAARRRFEDVGPMIQVSPESGAALALLVRATAPRRVLEVGTLFGYAATWMARALPAGGHLDTIELVDEHADSAERLFAEDGTDGLVTVHRGVAAEVLAGLEGPYDLAFIDADKEGYVAYLDHALRLVRPGGLVIADNVLWSGRISDPDEQDEGVRALRAYLERVREDEQLATTVLPIGDGLAASVVLGDGGG